MKTNRHVTQSEFRKLSQEVSLHFDTIEKRLDNVEKRLDNVEKRLQKIEETMATKEDVARLSLEILNLNNRLTRLENNVSTKEDINKILSFLDSFARQSETNNAKMIVHDARLNELESTQKDYGIRITRLESSIPN